MKFRLLEAWGLVGYRAQDVEVPMEKLPISCGSGGLPFQVRILKTFE